MFHYHSDSYDYLVHPIFFGHLRAKLKAMLSDKQNMFNFWGALPPDPLIYCIPKWLLPN